MPRIALAALLLAALAPLAACSHKSDSASSPASATPQASANGSGTAQDKAACDTISADLSAWGTAFADAADGLAGAAGDVTKTKVILDEVKGLDTKAANDLRAEAGKTNDAAVKKAATDLAAALDKINTQLDANEIAQSPDKLTAIFNSPDYTSPSDAYEKLCGGA